MGAAEKPVQSTTPTEQHEEHHEDHPADKEDKRPHKGDVTEESGNFLSVGTYDSTTWIEIIVVFLMAFGSCIITGKFLIAHCKSSPRYANLRDGDFDALSAVGQSHLS